STRASSTVSCNARCLAGRSRSSTSTPPASTPPRHAQSRRCSACRPPECRLQSSGMATTWPSASKVREKRRRFVLRTVALSGIAALVIALDWLRFEEPRSGGGRPLALALLAIAPVLLRPLWLRACGVAVSVLLGVWTAFSTSPLDLWPGGERFFTPLFSRFERGFLDFYDFRLPI